MKKIISIVILVALVVSCKTIEFKSPQPKGIAEQIEFPKNFRGKYRLNAIGEDDAESSDTLEVGKNFYVEDDGKSVFLSDTVMFKTYKGVHYFSAKEKKEKNWTVAILERKSNGNIMVYGLFFKKDEEKEELFEKINKITPMTIDSTGEYRKNYIIDPTPKELRNLYKNKLFQPIYEMIPIKE